MRRPTLSVAIALGLVLGLVLGLAASATGAGALRALDLGIEPLGTIWLNLLKMCVLPLVAAALVAGVGGLGDVRRLGRVGVRTVAFILGGALLAAFVGLGLALLLVRLAPPSPEVAARLRDAAAAGARDVTARVAEVRGGWRFLLDLVPANVVTAAAEGALLPVIVFAVLFGAATGVLAAGPRGAILQLAEAVVAALIRLIGWVMLAAPVGVLCLVAPVGARFGGETVARLGVFVVAVVLGTVLFAIAAYGPAARLLARVRIGPFARTIAPGTTVAFTTASSMAALPAMMDAALNRMRVSSGVAGFVLPQAATVNRPGTTIYQMTAVVFVASLYGLSPAPAQLAAALATSLLMTFSVAAIPAATVFTTAPVLLAAGLPIESLALLLGVDRVPDMFRTGLNAVGHQTATAVVARGEGEALA
jgi:Na+/H+-dicarboxylate symporter